MSIFDTNNHNLIALFEEIHSRVGVEPSSQPHGQVHVPGDYYNSNEAWVGNNWNNNSGYNSGVIEAIPDEGYVFVRWNYYEEVTSYNWTPAKADDINLLQQSFAPGTFRVDRDGKGWFLKAVFAQPPRQGQRQRCKQG